ncbi:MAG: hypothetical protein ACI9WU_004926 [Myxococcota bacterium]|jgi:hypothetical protein
MKIDWSGWDAGRKVVFLATCLALVSFLGPWSDYSQAGPLRSSRTFNAFSETWPLIGILGFLVALIPILKGAAFNKKAAYVGAVFALLIAVAFIATATKGNAIRSYNIAGMGSYLFLVCGVGLGVGTHMVE